MNRLDPSDEADIRMAIEEGDTVGPGFLKAAMDEIDSLRSHIAAAQYERWEKERRDKQAGAAVENAVLREACIETVNGGTDWQCALCLLMWPKGEPPRHDSNCILAVPADQAGTAIVSAGDAVVDWLDALRTTWLHTVYGSASVEDEAKTLIEAYRKARQRVGEG